MLRIHMPGRVAVLRTCCACRRGAALALTAAGQYTLAVQLAGVSSVSWTLMVLAQFTGPLTANVTMPLHEVRLGEQDALLTQACGRHGLVAGPERFKRHTAHAHGKLSPCTPVQAGSAGVRSAWLPECWRKALEQPDLQLSTPLRACLRTGL